MKTTMVGSGYGQSVAWGAFASAVVNVHLLSETKVYEATHACCAAVAQWLRCCAINRKVAGSIPDGVIGIFQ
jgi:hypothetical protein